MARPTKEFGKRNLPRKIEPPPIVYHAPRGLGGKPPRDSARLRSLAIVISACGVSAIAGLALVQALRNDGCRDADPNDPNASSCHTGGGGHGGGGGHWYNSGGSSGSGAHSASFGGFGATGESGAHSGPSGGGHGGGGE